MRRHGTETMYRHERCRCPQCVKAQAEAQAERKWRAKTSRKGIALKKPTQQLVHRRECRCSKCRQANADRNRRTVDLTREQAKHCQICGIRLSEHPFVACWREAMR